MCDIYATNIENIRNFHKKIITYSAHFMTNTSFANIVLQSNIYYEYYLLEGRIFLTAIEIF